MAEIESETKFLWKLLLKLLMTPITLIQILFGKKHLKDLFEPITLFFQFIYEAKFTFWLIIANIIVFFVSLTLNQAIFDSLLLYPKDILSSRIYTVITAGFLHANLTHLFGNMLALFIFGRIVERKLGFGKTVMLYFGSLIISGLISSAVYLTIGSNTGSLGASGAIAGMIATAILLDPLYITYQLLIPLPAMVLGWIFILSDITGILHSVDDGIGHFAHLGGFLAISILVFALQREERAKIGKGLAINIIFALIVGVIFYFM